MDLQTAQDKAFNRVAAYASLNADQDTRNSNYQGPKGAADEVILHFFKSNDAMVQALKSKQIDYAQNVNADQWEALKSDASITTVAGSASNFYEIAFNCYSKQILERIEQ